MASAERNASTAADNRVGTASAVGSLLDGDSAEWLRLLRVDGPPHDAAIGRLHEMLVRIAHAEVNRRSGRLRISGPELDDLAYQAAADALVAIMAKLDQFRGEGRFTTWAYKFVMFEVSAKIGRHFWRDARVSLEVEDWDRLPDRVGLDPARQAEWGDLVTELRRLVEEELSDHQRRVFVALVVDAVPLDALVVQLGTNRNAIYKALFDARAKLRACLVANGYLDSHGRGRL
jgi:RNA polymerase sigma-70 factor (ECF subfamily)